MLVVPMLLVSLFSEKYLKKLFGTNKDRMGMDQKAVLLLSKVNESKRHGEISFLLFYLLFTQQYIASLRNLLHNRSILTLV